MLTPWGELEVADAHLHFFSQAFFAALARQTGGTLESVGATLGFDIPAADPVQLATRWKDELDHHGVTAASLIASIPGDEASVIAAVAAYPDRFRGYFMFDPTAPEAVSRLSGALATGHVHAMCLFPAMHRYSVRDAMLAPVFECAATRPGFAVFVHCGVLTVGVRAKLGLPSLFDMHYSNPIDLHAVALRYPKLNFVIPHFGAGYFREALMLADLCPNVYLDTSSSNSWLKYQAAPRDLPQSFRRALDVVGPRRLLFGTDSSFFPRGWHRAIFDRQITALDSIGLSAADAARILGRNLLELFPNT